MKVNGMLKQRCAMDELGILDPDDDDHEYCLCKWMQRRKPRRSRHA